MYKITSGLLLYSSLGEDSILVNLSDIYRDWETGATDKAALSLRIYHEIKKLLDLATLYGFDKNLWHNYLTFILMTNENSFTLTAERVGASNGSVNDFARHDFEIFRQLFNFDFGPMEKDLGIDCFTTICNYRSIPKNEKNYYRTISEKVQALSKKLETVASEQKKDLCALEATDRGLATTAGETSSSSNMLDGSANEPKGNRNSKDFFTIITDFYKHYGVGMFGLNRAFHIRNITGEVEFLPINNADKIVLSDLIGYEIQKKALIDNTEAFLAGKPANNCLLYGDAGTGKSSCVKALINEYYDSGLRMIEIYKYQFKDLSAIISAIKTRNYRFIIYMDDLSFEENEIEYKFLKAVIEGGVESRPDNVLIYATSNRRHLIKETWSDRNDMEYENDIHRSDTMEEKLSLAARFGVSINFNAPNKKEYNHIVTELAKKQLGRKINEEELLSLANKWELRHGGTSGRTAQQFINSLSGDRN